MTIKETALLLGTLTTAYPKYYSNISENQIKNTISLWHEMLNDIDIESAKIALKSLIATNIFPPTIAEMRESVYRVSFGHPLESGEAWQEVIDAIRRYGYRREIEAINSMSETTKIAVMRLGYMHLCMSENIMADRAHFLKLYGAIAKRKELDNKLPIELKQTINTLIENNKQLEVKTNVLALDEVKPNIEDEKMPESVKKSIDELIGRCAIY